LLPSLNASICFDTGSNEERSFFLQEIDSKEADIHNAAPYRNVFNFMVLEFKTIEFCKEGKCAGNLKAL